MLQGCCVTMFGRYPPFRKSIYWGEGKKVLGYLCVNSPDCIFHIFKYTGSIIILVWLTIINLNLMQYVAVKISLKKYSVYQYVNNSMMYPYTNTHKLHRGKYIHVDKKKNLVKTWCKTHSKLIFLLLSIKKKTNIDNLQQLLKVYFVIILTQRLNKSSCSSWCSIESRSCKLRENKIAAHSQ